MGDGFDGVDEGVKSDRRDALKKIGIGAAAAWVAPTVLSMNTPASAASGCSCGTQMLGLLAGSFTGSFAFSSPPPTWTTTGAFNDLSMSQTVPINLACAGQTIEFRFDFSRTGTPNYAWAANLNSNAGLIDTDSQGVGTDGTKVLSGVVPVGATTITVDIAIDSTAAAVHVTNPILIVTSC